MTQYNTLITGYTGQDHLGTAAIGVKAIHGNLAEYDENIRFCRIRIYADRAIMACSPDVLNRGVEFGVPWDEIKLRATPESLCANLRNAGVWTLDDLRSKSEVVIGVLQATYGVDYQTLLRKFGG